MLTGAHHIDLAIEAARSGQRESSIELARAALRLAPQDPLIAEVAATLFFKADAYPNALAAIQSALAIESTPNRLRLLDQITGAHKKGP
jgi:hypothetical protein